MIRDFDVYYLILVITSTVSLLNPSPNLEIEEIRLLSKFVNGIALIGHQSRGVQSETGFEAGYNVNHHWRGRKSIVRYPYLQSH